jgi:phosphotransferase system HPr (HPr) family protein
MLVLDSRGCDVVWSVNGVVMMATIRRKVKVRQKYGLHARPAASFVKLARKFETDIILEKNGERVDGKSIMGVMMLAVSRGETVFLEASGPDGEHACEQLKAFLEDGTVD